jgi:hypothetical protein
MNVNDVQAWIGIVGVILGAGIGYGALTQRISSLEARTKTLESNLELFERGLYTKMDSVLDKVNQLALTVGRLEERISRTL